MHAPCVYLQMRHAETLLPLMTARELPLLLAAAASLHAPRSKAWTVAAMVRVRRVLGSFTPQGLALVLWALGRLDVRLRRGKADYAEQVGSRARCCVVPLVGQQVCYDEQVVPSRHNY